MPGIALPGEDGLRAISAARVKEPSALFLFLGVCLFFSGVLCLFTFCFCFWVFVYSSFFFGGGGCFFSSCAFVFLCFLNLPTLYDVGGRP